MGASRHGLEEAGSEAAARQVPLHRQAGHTLSSHFVCAPEVRHVVDPAVQVADVVPARREG